MELLNASHCGGDDQFAVTFFPDAPDIVRLREAGFALHWLKPRSKVPVSKGWSEAPIASIDVLRQTHEKGFNLGVRLGEPSRVGDLYLQVIDLDIRAAELADEAWAAFAELFPGVDIKTLPSVISGSGGESRHIYFLTDKPFHSKRLAVSAGKHHRHDSRAGKDVLSYDWEIELFGTGKQVAMPPSIHPDSGKPYLWERPFDFDMLGMGLGPFIPSAAIETVGGTEVATYAGEIREPLDFKPGQLERELDELPDSRLDDYQDWVTLGQALHHQFDGSEEGYDLWAKHSERSEKFPGERKLRQRWRGFGKSRRAPVTMATVRQWVQEARDEALLDQFDDIADDIPTPEAADDDKEKVPDWVERLNRQHAVAFVQGKTVILTDQDGGVVQYGSATDLHTFYENKRRSTDRGSEPITKAWMRHPKRRSYPNGIVFAPNGGLKGAYNHWKGFAVAPDWSGSCDLFLTHLRDVICSGDADIYGWVIRWFAHMIQRPEQKPGTALVVKGSKGAGKDTVGDYVGGLFPHHHTKIANAEHLTGRFNAHQERTLLLHVEEGFWAGDKKAEGALKHLITSEQVQIERKGIDAFQVDSVLRLFISSNEDWVVPATFDERRFCVLNVSNRRARDKAYFDALRSEMENGGRAALLHHFQALDLKDFDVRNPPMTEGLRDQKLASLKNVDKWWCELLTDGEIPGIHGSAFDGELTSWDIGGRVSRDTLREHYMQWIREHRYQGEVLNERAFGKRLRALAPDVDDFRSKPKDGPRVRYYRLPPLRECRKAFEKVVGYPVEWNDGDQE